MADLFGEDARQLKGRGYAGHPGAGPAGQTCGTCVHFLRSGRGYHKCSHPHALNSNGPGTDILVSAPACEHWEQR